MTTMKKSGSIFAVLSGCIVGFIFIVKLNKIKNKNLITVQPTIEQYLNRLNEFSMFDLDNVEEEFYSFLDMGFNLEDAFQLTVIKRIYI